LIRRSFPSKRTAVLSHFPVLRAAAVLAALLLAGCSAGPLPNSGMSFGAVGGNLMLPVTSIQGRKFLSVIRQQYDFSCGSAALATLLSYQYGDPQDEAAIFRGMWANGDRAQIRRLGFSLLDMKRYLQDRGMDGDGYRVSLEQIAKTGLPGIGLITTNGYRHFVTIKGVAGDRVLVGDPSLGLRTMTRDEFLEMWNGVYFVVDHKKKAQFVAFNAASDWSLIPTARYSLAAEPMSLQALGLLRPGFGEF
jgi:predicted double-glycine peptidase